MYKSISANKRNSLLIIGLFVGLVVGIGYITSYLLGGDSSITLYVFVGVLIYALIQYYMADKIAVAISGAEEIQKKDNPRLYRIVENLAITLGFPTPKVYIINDSAPNAFATGRDPNHSLVAVTTGLLDIMTDDELEAVMAHEMGHIQNYDIRLSMIAFGLVSAIGLLTDIVIRILFFGGNRRDNVHPAVYLIGLIAIILAPIIASMVQLALSRQREYLADASGALTTRHPDAMISALEKLLHHSKPLKRQHSASAHLFLVNPLKHNLFSRLFSTHPPLEERIKRLQESKDKF